MYNSADSKNDYSLQSVDDARLMGIVRKYTDLPRCDIDILLEVSHTLYMVSELEGGDIFIDCLSRDGQCAVVVAQYSPTDESNYDHNIVGDPMYRHNEPGVFRTLEIGVPSRELKAVVNHNILIRQNVSAIKNAEGRIIGVLIVERNLREPSNRESAENSDENPIYKTIYNAREMQNIAEYMHDAMIRFNTMGVSVYANPRARQIYRGLDYKDDIVGMSFENLAFGSYSFREVVEKERIEHTEIKIGKYFLNVLYACIRDDDQFMGAVLLIKDTTQEKINEKELILKSTAIDEIHHRVKNNLQTIVSLIRLQSRRINHPEVRRVCGEIISRIYSISLTHEILAQKGVDAIDIKEMLGRMVNGAKGYIIPDGLNLELEISGDSFTLQSDIATTIAMVVNELIQNCIKHAFVGRRDGRVSLVISKGDMYSSIVVADNGVGIDSTAERAGSLGHKLVRSLVEDKLKGSIRVDSSGEGTQIFFDFIRGSAEN